MSPSSGSKTERKEVSIGPVPVDIPVDWDLVTLGDVSENSGQYGANVSAEPFDPTEFRYVRITDLTEDGQMKDDDRKSIPIEGNEKYRLSEGDLLFARTGSVGRTYLYSESDSDVPCAFAGYLIRFKLSDKINHRYLQQYTNSEYFNRWVNSVARSTTHANINASEYSSVDIPFPPLSEQRRIADILSTVDELIQQTDEVIKKTRELKQGLMQDLLYNGIDNSNFTEVTAGPKTFEIPKSWGFSDVGSVITRLREGMNETQNQDEDGVPVTRIETISDRFVDFDSIGWISSPREDFEDFKLQKGDILLSHKNSLDHIGKTAQFWSDRELYHGENLLLLRFDNDIVNPLFAFYFLNTNLVNQICRSWARRFVSQVTLNQHEVEALPMILPPKKEQEKIADRIFCVDTKIDVEKDRRDKLKELKQGLMRDLLTGKVRVNTD